MSPKSLTLGIRDRMLNTTNVSASELCEVSSVSAYLHTHPMRDGNTKQTVLNFEISCLGEPGSKATYLVKLVVLDKLICPSTYMYGVLVCPKH